MTSQFIRSNSYKVTYPDFPSFEIYPDSFRLIQKAGHQDIAEIKYKTVSTFYQKALKPGSLVKVEWSNASKKGVFVGQVLSVKPFLNVSQNTHTMIKAIGTGLSMKENESKIWVNKRASDIVSEISKKFKLNPIIHPTKVILSQESMVGQTYWEKLRDLANQSGCVFHVHGTDLLFLPLDIMINKFVGNAPLLTLDLKYTLGEDTDEMSTLIEFNYESQLIPPKMAHSNRNKNIAGVDPVSGKLFIGNNSPSRTGKQIRKNKSTQYFSEQLFDVTVGSKNLAELKAKAAAELSRFSENATGIALGDPRIAPFKSVQVEGTGPNSDGLWVVKSADHRMSYSGRYVVDFTCMTDGSGGNKETSFRQTPKNSIAKRNIAFEMSSGFQTKPSTTKLDSRRPLIAQNNSGLELKQRRWVGR